MPEYAIDRLCFTLLHFLWQGAAIVAVWQMSVVLLKLRSASDRYRCTLMALFTMAACPVATYAVLCSMRPAEFDVASVTTAPLLADTELPTSMSTIGAPAVKESETAFTVQPWQWALVGGWSVGVVLFGIRLVCGWLFLQRIKRRVAPLTAELQQRVDAIKAKLGMRRGVRVVSSTDVVQAVAWGIWRPLVVLPTAWILKLPPDALDAVIAHELAHLKRWDPWVVAIQRTLETLLFYHPAIWWLSKRLTIEREMCCDELAVGATGHRLGYVQTLEQVARGGFDLASPTLATAFGGDREMNLLNRVRNVLGMPPLQSGRRWWPVGLLTLLIPIAVYSMATGVVPWDAAAAFADDDDDERERRERGERRERERRETRDGDRDDREGNRERRTDRSEREGRRETIRDRDVRRAGREEADERRDGDERREVRVIRREGDREFADEERREGERREGERRIEIRREGERREGEGREGEQGEVRRFEIRLEADRDGLRIMEGRGDGPLGNFRPQNEREGLLLDALRSLHKELAELRQEVSALRRGSTRDGDGDRRRDTVRSREDQIIRRLDRDIEHEDDDDRPPLADRVRREVELRLRDEDRRSETEARRLRNLDRRTQEGERRLRDQDRRSEEENERREVERRVERERQANEDRERERDRDEDD